MIQSDLRKLTVLLFILLCSIQTSAQKIYWTTFPGNTINQGNLDGSNSAVLINTGATSNPLGLGIDSVNNKLYWTNFLFGSIRYSNFDGSSNQEVHFSSIEQPTAIDMTNTRIFWSVLDSGTGKNIQSADLDGSNNVIVTSITGECFGIALDTDNGHVYWTEYSAGTGGVIKRADTDGNNPLTVYTTGVSSVPLGLAVDTATDVIYFVDDGNNQIRSVNFDGTNPQILIASGITTPHDIELHNDRLYWTDPGNNEINSSLTDGTDFQNIFSGLSFPYGIAILANRAPLADAGGAYAINEGDVLNLDATGSSDPDNDPLVSHLWDLDNDSLFDDAAGETVAVNWTTLYALGWNEGVFPVSLEVSDGSGTGTSVTTVSVTNLPPNVISGGPYTIDEGMVLNVDASLSTDPGLDVLTFSWDLDNNSIEDAGTAAAAFNWAELFSLGILDGQNLVSLDVSDGAATVESTVEINVNNLAPVGMVDSYAADANLKLNISAPGVLGNDSDPGLDTLTVSSHDAFSSSGAEISILQNGTLTYDPRFAAALQALNNGETLTDYFQYTLYDGIASVQVVVEVTVTGSDAVPFPVSGTGACLLLIVLLSCAGVYKLRRKLSVYGPL